MIMWTYILYIFRFNDIPMLVNELEIRAIARNNPRPVLLPHYDDSSQALRNVRNVSYLYGLLSATVLYRCATLVNLVNAKLTAVLTISLSFQVHYVASMDLSAAYPK